MKTDKIIIKILMALFFFGSVLQAGAQDMNVGQQVDSREELLEMVLEANPILIAAREGLDASILDAMTGNLPPDPEVEFGYMNGKPDGTGTKMDFSVFQRFDFPSTYIHMSRLKKLNTANAEIIYLINRQEVLSQAGKLWIERIYLNRKAALLEQRFGNAETLLQHFGQMLDMGEISALTYNQTKLHVIGLQAELEQLRTSIISNHLALEELTGKKLSEIEIMRFPQPSLTNADSVLAAYESEPMRQYYQMETMIREGEQQLARSRHLPKFSAGYYSETVIDHQYKGLKLGITVPLWENAHSINKAKADLIYAKADEDRFISQQMKELRQGLAMHASLQKQAEVLEAAVKSINDEVLLRTSLEAGEISLAEYLFSSELYFSKLVKLETLNYELLVLEADLMKVYY